ncbi:hypothetical protein FJY68_04735 [candidate division WOR-3 bacterium]|uniref:Lipoprotein n=1 Tax=candidate division WOR-3 bacterium TaxID=2052148 RepID=A0A937XCG5_UNCW3|nr:hypothetical protein [candidate division WOR-3 bacterium]
MKGFLVCLPLALVLGCSLHFSRGEFRYPPTAGPAELRMSIVSREQHARAGEPFFVTVSVVNTTDSVCTAAVGNWEYEGPATFVLIGQAGDTWDYRPNIIAGLRVLLGPSFFGIEPHDSLYRHYVRAGKGDTILNCLRSASRCGQAPHFGKLRDNALPEAAS